MQKEFRKRRVWVFLAALLGMLYFYLNSYIATLILKLFTNKGISTSVVVILFSFFTIIFLAFIISAIGISYRKRWALTLLIVLTIFALLHGIKPLFLFSYYSVIGLIGILFIILSLTTLWLACKKTTREQFGLSTTVVRLRGFRALNRILANKY